MEQWKPVKGYEGQFLVSDLGRIMNDHGLILKTKRDASNNLIVTLKGKDMRVALAVAHAFVHNPNAFQYQRYKDGDKGNCRADNIEWGMPGRDNNDGLSKAIVLVKDGEVLELPSVSAAARYLHTLPNTLKESAYNKAKNIRVHGYFIAWADDEERINQLLEGVECVKSLEGEEWRDLPELQGEYQVSNLGRVKRIKGVERLRKITIQKNGYAYVSLSFDNTAKTVKVSRLVAKAFIPNPNNYEEVDHINADKTNNTVSNLEWVTPEENKRRAQALGLLKKKPKAGDDPS
jgi:hypothetical protein